MFNLDYEIEALRELFRAERKEATTGPLPSLSRDQRLLVRRYRSARTVANMRAAYLAMDLAAQMHVNVLEIRDHAKSPLLFSKLPEWLELETWKPRDALLLLAGALPSGAVVDWSYKNFIGAEIDSPKIRACTLLSEIHDQYGVPTRDDWNEDIKEIQQQMLDAEQDPLATPEEQQRLKDKLGLLVRCKNDKSVIRHDSMLSHTNNILAALSKRWFSGDHDAEKRSPPSHFTNWAMARGFTPEWYEFAKSCKWIGADESVYRATFFDADKSDYPMLLHIAVRAWEAAREGTVGTPKQRIASFVESRYPKLNTASRELIATIANWDKTGGRPKQS